MAAKGDPHYPLRPECADVSEEFREPVARLGKIITDRIPIKLGKHEITKDDPEYWAVARLCTDEEAELAIKAFKKIRQPKTFADIQKAAPEIPAEKLQKMLDHMSWTGLIEWNYENPQHEKQYVLPMFVPGSGEFSNMNKDLIEEHPELGMFFEHMTRLPLEKVTPMVPEGGAGIGMHVIPVEKAIEMNNEAVGIEKISH
ncbi:MAG TPA: pyridine nucleotide-disulfide oxidoreductase, partial [Lachnospiraceae bacterium]|nr:pyridine nucleotide-disulfide oxidoreductase [Lachnospiraceae bacterium]